MRLPRMTTRRWMIAAAVVALICAGLFTGCPRLAAASLVCLVAMFGVLWIERYIPGHLRRVPHEDALTPTLVEATG